MMEHIFQNNVMDDFFVTVQSDKCKEFFNENSPNAFSNVLYKQLELNTDTYEVGLSEIFLAYTEPNVEPTKPTTPPPTSSTFFIDPGSDNIITAVKLIRHHTKFVKRDENFVNFFEGLRQHTESLRGKIGIELSKNYTTIGGPPHTVLKFDDPESEYTLQIPGEWAEYFGFNTNTFTAGTYVSEFPQSEEVFKNIPVGSTFTTTYSKWDKKTVEIEEPEDFDIEELVENVVSSIKRIGYSVRMPLLKTREGSEMGSLHVYLEDGVRIQLPVSVNRALGKPDNFQFVQELTTVEFPLKINIDVPAVPKVPKRLVPIPGRHVIVSTNIVEPQMYASSHQQVLRRFLKSEIKATEHLTFNPVQYLMLTTKHIRTIQISITDENILPINTYDFPTTIILHFRRKQ